MFYGGMAGAAIALVVAILVYVKLNIPQVITDLTGRKFPGAGRKPGKDGTTGTKPVTKEINVRKNVELEVAVAYAVDPTEKMLSGPVEPTALMSEASFEPTALLTENKKQGVAPTTLLSSMHQAPGTTPSHPAETTMLEDWGETSVLTADPDETTLLDEFNETSVLTHEEEPRFKKQVDIVVVHSETII